MMSQHSNSLATATAAILVHNENCAPKWPPFPWQKNACKRSIVEKYVHNSEREVVSWESGSKCSGPNNY